MGGALVITPNASGLNLQLAVMGCRMVMRQQLIVVDPAMPVLCVRRNYITVKAFR
jgi:hypothetical protein